MGIYVDHMGIYVDIVYIYIYDLMGIYVDHMGIYVDIVYATQKLGYDPSSMVIPADILVDSARVMGILTPMAQVLRLPNRVRGSTHSDPGSNNKRIHTSKIWLNCYSQSWNN